MRKRIYEIIEVAGENDLKSKIYDSFMLVCIIISVIPLCFKEQNLIFILFDRVTVVVFIVDYILRFITADYKIGKGSVRSRLIYPFTPMAIIDLISILSSINFIPSVIRVFRVIRVNKALKALRILRYSKNFNLIKSVIKKESRALGAVCMFAVGYVFVCAMIMFQVEPDSFDTFFDSLYWAVVTLTTVGYGDIYPVSDVGRVISMISSLMGIAIVALPTGIITAGFTNELAKKSEEKENEERYKEFEKNRKKEKTAKDFLKYTETGKEQREYCEINESEQI